MSEKDTPPGSNGSFDPKQYELLCSCADKGDFSEWNSLVDEIVEKYKASLVSGETCDIPEIKLVGADLAQRNLKGIKLLFANLEGADLHGANLEWADLRWAKLSRANLENVRLFYKSFC